MSHEEYGASKKDFHIIAIIVIVSFARISKPKATSTPAIDTAATWPPRLRRRKLLPRPRQP
jgi:hypothetical protein